MQHISGSYDGLTDLADCIKDKLSDDTVEVYLKLYLLLYADDTVIFAESDVHSSISSWFYVFLLWKVEIGGEHQEN